MNTIPNTSRSEYITGKAALNVPYEDGTFADWHFHEVFLSGRGKIRIAGRDIPDTKNLLGDYGIWECSEVLRRFGAEIPENYKVYTANHIRAILDMVISSLSKHRLPLHVTVHDMLDTQEELSELKTQVTILKNKITDQVLLTLLQTWEKQQL